MYGKRLWVSLGLFGTLAACVIADKPVSPRRDVRKPKQQVPAPASLSAATRVLATTTVPGNRPAIAHSLTERVSASLSAMQHVGRQNVAGGPLGSPVYRNDTLNPTLYRPGAGVRVADDLRLASGPTTLLQYSLVVLGNGQSGAPTFNVHTELWDGDPCEPASAIIPNTGRDFADIVNDGSLVELSAFFDTGPIAIPGTVYLAVTFGPAPAGDDAGWIVADRPELGFTKNEWSEQPPAGVCDQFFFGCASSYAGFWASIFADITTAELGACCDGASCSEVLLADCTVGAWQGPFTGCAPNPCAAGACCTGDVFNTCAETTQAGCLGGLFYQGATCDTSPCAPIYADYANTFDVNGFHRVDANILRADDIKRLGDGACELGGYEILAIGNGTAGPSTFEATIELWTNLEGDPTTDLDDTPDAPIPGTSVSFHMVPADFCPQRLVAGSFAGDGIMVPKELWASIKTDSNFAGPMISGPAKIGGSVDGVAEFGTTTPDVWTPGFFFGGFDPTGCPDADTCVPAGSYRVIVWCAGTRPTGACCDDFRGTCTDDVADVDCAGRWAAGETCASNSFNPPCAHNACCAPNLLNPNVLACVNLSRADCAALDPPGAFSPGQFCQGVSCPSIECFNSTGDCFTGRQTGGCEDAFCCDKVCAIDDFCCSNRWDGSCAATAVQECRPPANDEFQNAEVFSGQGDIPFDNGSATNSGPSNAACASFGDLDGINNDLWYCWTAPCTDLIAVQTCNLTTVDTVVAVYSGCVGPPSDANLVACNDDTCGFQSRATFVANAGNDYLIRVGSFSAAGTGGDQFPLVPFGPGSVSVTCSGASHPACPGLGNCCDTAGTGSVACDDTLCCNLVCACDPFCCDNEWDEFCATTGFEGNGCGAQVLCTDTCVPSCPVGTVNWVDPPDGVVDARISTDLVSGKPLGIDLLRLQAPPGADAACFTLCETANVGTANSIVDVSEVPIAGGVMSEYTISLARPMTPFAVTTITYTDDDAVPTTGTFTTHPGNVNGGATATAADISSLINVLNGIDVTTNAPWDLYSSDVDHSGSTRSPDILAAIDALNGAGPLTPAANTAKPSASGVCP